MKGWVVLMLGFSASAATAHAQQGETGEVPAQYAPPPGMCRVWLAGVPAAQQPAPTDCATAIRKRPSQGRVLFGADRETARPVVLPARPPAATADEDRRARREPASEERRARREPADEQRRDPPRAEPRTEPRTEPRNEPQAEPRAESRAERTRRGAPPSARSRQP
jgi:hypothetical protein